MRVAAPGKLLLTGSYAVLEGAPAVVCAVNRLAIAGGESTGAAVSPEVEAARTAMNETWAAPSLDVSSLFSGDLKLGLGSSAAAVVAALGYWAVKGGQDLKGATVRRAIFERARAAHAKVQSGGSGVDIAASVYGGVLRFCLNREPAPAPSLAPLPAPAIHPVSLPPQLRVDTYWSGKSVRTSDMRARVDALKAGRAGVWAARMADLASAAEDAVTAIDRRDGRGFVDAARASERGLTALGRDADAPIVPPYVRDLVRMAEEEGAAFLPSGAGGGDVFVRLGLEPPSAHFSAEARALGLEELALEIDVLGVRTLANAGDPSA